MIVVHGLTVRRGNVTTLGQSVAVALTVECGTCRIMCHSNAVGQSDKCRQQPSFLVLQFHTGLPKLPVTLPRNPIHMVWHRHHRPRLPMLYG